MIDALRHEALYTVTQFLIAENHLVSARISGRSFVRW
jgi:hypothetical protein